MERGAHLQYIVKVSDLYDFEFWLGLMICKCPDNIRKIAVNFALKMLKLKNWLNPTWFQWKYGLIINYQKNWKFLHSIILIDRRQGIALPPVDIVLPSLTPALAWVQK